MPVSEVEDGLSLEQRAMRDRMLYDFRFFCSKLKIRLKGDLVTGGSGEGALAPFIWNEPQEIIWAKMQLAIAAGQPIRLVILKARQFGVSTFFCAWLFWWMWRRTEVRALISAHQKLTLGVMLETMNRFYESFPPGFRPQLRASGPRARIGKEEVYFADRKSGALITPAHADAGRGDAYDLALCTEVAAYDDAANFFGGFIPAMGRRVDTSLIMESSPQPGWFWERYKNAKRFDQDVFLPWMVARSLYTIPLESYTARGRVKAWRDVRTKERVTFTPAEIKEQQVLSRLEKREGREAVTWGQMYWRQIEIESTYDGDEEYFNQEYPRDDVTCFEKSVRSAFKNVLPIIRATVEETLDESAEWEDAAIGRLESDTVARPDAEVQRVAFVNDDHVDFERWPGIFVCKRPQSGFVYTIGVDVADDINTSADEDDANFSVISVYCCNTREQVAEWRGGMDPHELGDEVAMVGYFYNTAMVCVEYNNMGITTVDRLTKYLEYPNRFRWPKWDEANKFTKKEMWVTDEKSKQLMIGSLRYAIKNGNYKVRSPGLQEELTGYQVNSGRYAAGPDTYADRIIAAALSWQCVEQTDYGSSIVLGAIDAPGEKAAGAAKRYVVTTPRGNPFVVPRELPADLEIELSDMAQTVEDLWGAANF